MSFKTYWTNLVKLCLHPNAFKMYCKLTGWEWLNRPTCPRSAWHCSPPSTSSPPPAPSGLQTATADPAGLSQSAPPWAQETLPHTPFKKFANLFRGHQRGKNNPPPRQKKAFNLFTPGGRHIMPVTLEDSYCTKTSRKRKAYEYLIGIRRAKGSVCRFGW